MSHLRTLPIREQVKRLATKERSDVPIFARAFDREAGKTVVIFQKSSIHALGPSVLRGDPGSGQTPGFPQRAEGVPEQIPVPSALFEDPTLVRIPLDSEKLRLHLRMGDTSASIASQTQQVAAFIFEAQEGITLAPPEWIPPVWIEPTIIEKAQARAEKSLRAAHNLTNKFQKNTSFLFRLLVGHASSLNIQTHSIYFFAQCREKVRVASTSLLALFSSSLRYFATVRSNMTHTIEDMHASSMVQRKRLRRFVRPRTVTLSFPRLTFRPSRRLVSSVGQGMIVSSIVLFLLTIGPIIRLQAGEWWVQTRVAVTGKAQEPAIRETLTDTVRKPEQIPPEEKQFQLLIPKIGANMKVIPNVDAGDENAYVAALKQGVAHAAGSGLPGEENTNNRTIYIFGHSTNGVWNIAKYNALFYSLKDMVPGDDITVWFWGKEYHYHVTKVVKIDPSDLTYLQPQTLKDQLILQTCWPPGTTWKRLLVIAEPS